MARKTLTSLLIICIIATLAVSFSLSNVFSQSGLERIVIAQRDANIRQSPSASAAIVGTLLTGESALVIDTNPNGELVSGNRLWYQVRLANGVEGWVWDGAVITQEVTPMPSSTPRPTIEPNPNYDPVGSSNVANMFFRYQWGAGIPHVVAWSQDDQIAIGIIGGVLFYPANDLNTTPIFVKDDIFFSPTWLNSPEFKFVGDYAAGIASDPQNGVYELRLYSPAKLTGPTKIINTTAPIRHFAGNPNNPNQVVIVTADHRVAVYSVESGQLLKQIRPSRGEVAPMNAFNLYIPIAFSADGSRLAVTVYEPNAPIAFAIYDASANYRLIKEIAVPVRGGESVLDPRSLVLSTDGSQLMTFGHFQSLRLINIETEQVSVIAAGYQIGRAAFNGTHFAYGASWITYIDPSTARTLTDLPTLEMGDFAFSPDGSQVVTVDEDSGLLQIADAATLAIQETVQLGTTLDDADISADGKRLAVLSGTLNRNGSQIAIYNTRDESGIPETIIHLPENIAGNEIALHPDGNELVVGGMIRGTQSTASTQWLWLYDVNTGEKLKEASFGNKDIDTIQRGYFLDMTWHPNGTTLAIASHDGLIRLWDYPTWSLIHYFTASQGRIQDLAYSPNGNYIAAASIPSIQLKQPEIVRIFDSNGRVLHRLNQGAWTGYNSLSFSPDSRHLSATGYCYDGCTPTINGDQIISWDVQTGALVDTYSFGNYVGPITSLAYTNDGQAIAAINTSNNLRFWNIETGRMALSRPTGVGNRGYDAQSNQIFFSPDSALFFILNAPDGFIQVWGVAHRAEPTPTPTAQPSATPTQAPTHTPTPMPPEILFADDFESGALSTWHDSNGIAEIVTDIGNKSLVLKNSSDEFAIVGPSTDSWQDYAVSLDLRLLSSTPDHTDFFINLRENESGGYGVLFDIESQSVGFLSGKDGDFFELAIVETPLALNRRLQVRVEVIATHLSLYINNQLVSSIDNDHHQAGGFTFSLAPSVSVEVDNIQVEAR